MTLATAENRKNPPKAPVADARPHVKLAPEPPPDWGWHPAKPARWHRRHWAVLLSFVLLAALPAALAGWYMFARAADQYVSHLGFSIRSEEQPLLPGLESGFGSLASATSPGANDAELLQSYLASPDVVAAINAEIDLAAKWSAPYDHDPVFALPHNAGPEALYEYWLNAVQVTVSGTSGLVSVQVRAFNPQDAQQIGQAIQDKSKQIIAEMSAVSEAEFTRAAAKNLGEAEARLSGAIAALTTFRNTHQIIDPEADLEARMGVLTSLEEALAETLINRDLLIGETRASDARITAAERRIAVIEARIEAERNRLGLVGDDHAMAVLVGQYEKLVAEREFAQEAWVAARAAYDAALDDARRESRFLAVFQRPNLPFEATGPDRVWLTLLISLAAFTLWLVALLMVYSFKDRR